MSTRLYFILINGSDAFAIADHPYRPRVVRSAVREVREHATIGYKPPSTSYFRHSIYSYNKNAEKVLPCTTVNANKLIRAYFNMEPSQRYAELLAGSTQSQSTEDPTGDQLPQSNSQRLEDDLVKELQELGSGSSFEQSVAEVEGPWREPSIKEQLSKLHKGETEAEDKAKAMTNVRQKYERDVKRRIKEHKTRRDRIYVSDRGYTHKGLLRQDILGKISQRMQPKTAFHYPYKALQEKQPQITYKHYRDGVGISVHVHEGSQAVSYVGPDGRKGSRRR